MPAAKTVLVQNNTRSIVAILLPEEVDYETAEMQVKSNEIEIPRRTKGDHVAPGVILKESVWEKLSGMPSVAGLVSSGALQVF